MKIQIRDFQRVFALSVTLLSALLGSALSVRAEEARIDFESSLPVTQVRGAFVRELSARNRSLTRATCVLDVQPSGTLTLNPDAIVIDVDNETILVQVFVFMHHGTVFPKQFYGSTDFQRSYYPIQENWRQQGWPNFVQFPGGSTFRRAQYVDGILHIEVRHDSTFRTEWEITTPPDLSEMSEVRMRSYRRTTEGREALEDEIVCSQQAPIT